MVAVRDRDLHRLTATTAEALTSTAPHASHQQHMQYRRLALLDGIKLHSHDMAMNCRLVHHRRLVLRTETDEDIMMGIEIEEGIVEEKEIEAVLQQMAMLLEMAVERQPRIKTRIFLLIMSGNETIEEAGKEREGITEVMDIMIDMQVSMKTGDEIVVVVAVVVKTERGEIEIETEIHLENENRLEEEKEVQQGVEVLQGDGVVIGTGTETGIEIATEIEVVVEEEIGTGTIDGEITANHRSGDETLSWYIHDAI